MGKDWADPFVPHPKMFQTFYVSFFFWILLLSNCIFTLINDLLQRINQGFKPNSLLVLLHCGSVKAQSFPLNNVLICLFIFQFMLLFHCILTFMNDLFQRESQFFKPTSLSVLLHCGVGKDWVGPLFPPSKMLCLFYLTLSHLDNATHSSFLNTYE